MIQELIKELYSKKWVMFADGDDGGWGGSDWGGGGWEGGGTGGGTDSGGSGADASMGGGGGEPAGYGEGGYGGMEAPGETGVSGADVGGGGEPGGGGFTPDGDLSGPPSGDVNYGAGEAAATAAAAAAQSAADEAAAQASDIANQSVIDAAMQAAAAAAAQSVGDATAQEAANKAYETTKQEALAAARSWETGLKAQPSMVGKGTTVSSPVDISKQDIESLKSVTRLQDIPAWAIKQYGGLKEAAHIAGLVNEAGVTTQKGIANGLPAGVIFTDMYVQIPTPEVMALMRDTDKWGKTGDMTLEQEMSGRKLIKDYDIFPTPTDKTARLSLNDVEKISALFMENPWITALDFQYFTSELPGSANFNEFRRLENEGKKLQEVDPYDGTLKVFSPVAYFDTMRSWITYGKYHVPHDKAFTDLAQEALFLQNNNGLTAKELKGAQDNYAVRLSQSATQGPTTWGILTRAVQEGKELGFGQYAYDNTNILRPVEELTPSGKWAGQGKVAFTPDADLTPPVSGDVNYGAADRKSTGGLNKIPESYKGAQMETTLQYQLRSSPDEFRINLYAPTPIQISRDSNGNTTGMFIPTMEQFLAGLNMQHTLGITQAAPPMDRWFTYDTKMVDGSGIEKNVKVTYWVGEGMIQKGVKVPVAIAWDTETNKMIGYTTAPKIKNGQIIIDQSWETPKNINPSNPIQCTNNSCKDEEAQLIQGYNFFNDRKTIGKVPIVTYEEWQAEEKGIVPPKKDATPPQQPEATPQGKTPEEIKAYYAKLFEGIDAGALMPLPEVAGLSVEEKPNETNMVFEAFGNKDIINVNNDTGLATIYQGGSGTEGRIVKHANGTYSLCGGTGCLFQIPSDNLKDIVIRKGIPTITEAEDKNLITSGGYKTWDIAKELPPTVTIPTQPKEEKDLTPANPIIEIKTDTKPYQNIRVKNGKIEWDTVTIKPFIAGIKGKVIEGEGITYTDTYTLDLDKKAVVLNTPFISQFQGDLSLRIDKDGNYYAILEKKDGTKEVLPSAVTEVIKPLYTDKVHTDEWYTIKDKEAGGYLPKGALVEYEKSLGSKQVPTKDMVAVGSFTVSKEFYNEHKDAITKASRLFDSSEEYVTTLGGESYKRIEILQLPLTQLVALIEGGTKAYQDIASKELSELQQTHIQTITGEYVPKSDYNSWNLKLQDEVMKQGTKVINELNSLPPKAQFEKMLEYGMIKDNNGKVLDKTQVEFKEVDKQGNPSYSYTPYYYLTADKGDVGKMVWQGLTPWKEEKGEQASVSGVALMPLTVFLPYLQTALDWDNLSVGEKISYIALDTALMVIPAGVVASRGISAQVRAGALVGRDATKAAAKVIGRAALAEVTSPFYAMAHPLNTIKAPFKLLMEVVRPSQVPEWAIARGVYNKMVVEAGHSDLALTVGMHGETEGGTMWAMQQSQLKRAAGDWDATGEGLAKIKFSPTGFEQLMANNGHLNFFVHANPMMESALKDIEKAGYIPIMVKDADEPALFGTFGTISEFRRSSAKGIVGQIPGGYFVEVHLDTIPKEILEKAKGDPKEVHKLMVEYQQQGKLKGRTMPVSKQYNKFIEDELTVWAAPQGGDVVKIMPVKTGRVTTIKTRIPDALLTQMADAHYQEALQYIQEASKIAKSAGINLKNTADARITDLLKKADDSASKYRKLTEEAVKKGTEEKILFDADALRAYDQITGRNQLFIHATIGGAGISAKPWTLGEKAKMKLLGWRNVGRDIFSPALYQVKETPKEQIVRIASGLKPEEKPRINAGIALHNQLASIVGSPDASKLVSDLSKITNLPPNTIPVISDWLRNTEHTIYGSVSSVAQNEVYRTRITQGLMDSPSDLDVHVKNPELEMNNLSDRLNKAGVKAKAEARVTTTGATSYGVYVDKNGKWKPIIELSVEFQPKEVYQVLKLSNPTETIKIGDFNFTTLKREMSFQFNQLLFPGYGEYITSRIIPEGRFGAKSVGPMAAGFNRAKDIPKLETNIDGIIDRINAVNPSLAKDAMENRNILFGFKEHIPTGRRSVPEWVKYKKGGDINFPFSMPQSVEQFQKETDIIARVYGLNSAPVGSFIQNPLDIGLLVDTVGIARPGKDISFNEIAAIFGSRKSRYDTILHELIHANGLDDKIVSDSISNISKQYRREGFPIDLDLILLNKADDLAEVVAEGVTRNIKGHSIFRTSSMQLKGYDTNSMGNDIANYISGYLRKEFKHDSMTVAREIQERLYDNIQKAIDNRFKDLPNIKSLSKIVDDTRKAPDYIEIEFMVRKPEKSFKKSAYSNYPIPNILEPDATGYITASEFADSLLAKHGTTIDIMGSSSRGFGTEDEAKAVAAELKNRGYSTNYKTIITEDGNNLYLVEIESPKLKELLSISDKVEGLNKGYKPIDEGLGKRFKKTAYSNYPVENTLEPNATGTISASEFADLLLDKFGTTIDTAGSSSRGFSTLDEAKAVATELKNRGYSTTYKTILAKDGNKLHIVEIKLPVGKDAERILRMRSTEQLLKEMPEIRAQMAAKNIQSGLYQSAKELRDLMDIRMTAPSPYVTTMSARRLVEPISVRIPPPREIPRIPYVETPRVEPPRFETPRIEPPRIEPPRVEIPRIETPRVTTPRIETPRLETPRIETPRLETPRIETPRLETPRIETPRVTPPRIPPPTIKPPKIPPPKKSGQEQFEMLTKEQKLASVAWKQGWIYHLVYPPYGTTNVLHSRFSFPGVKEHKGVKSAYESLARIKGNVLPEKIRWNMGQMDITFQRGQGTVKMEYVNHPVGQPKIRRPEGMPKPVSTAKVRTTIATGIRF